MMHNNTPAWISLLVRDFLSLTTSTTLFLEKLSGRALQVQLLAQAETHVDDRPVVTRESILHVGDPQTPLMYARCTLYREALESIELEKLRLGYIPIGRIFDPDGRGLIVQADSRYRADRDAEELSLLSQCPDDVEEVVYTRSYQLTVDGRHVAQIDESVTELSLLRCFSGEQWVARWLTWLCCNKQTAAASLADGQLQCAYSEIPNHLQQIEDHLKSAGILADDGVILICTNTLTTALTLLAIIRAGINLHLLPASSSHAGKGSVERQLPTFLRYIVKTAETPEAHAVDLRQPHTFLRVEPNPAYDLAVAESFALRERLLVKTSGSLGRPKLAVHQPEKLLGNILRVAERLGLTPEDRISIPVPIFHMYGLEAAFLPGLFAGASLDLQENSNLLKFLEREETFAPSVAFVTPTFCKTLVVRRGARHYRFIVVAGERISEDVFRQVESKMGLVVNLYGSTEMGVIAATAADLSSAVRATSVGTVLSGFRLRLGQSKDSTVTEFGQELWLHNEFGFDGYVDPSGRQLQTEELSDDGWYCSGDLVRIDENGFLTILGRNSLSLNRNGFLVVFAEIEYAMLQIPEIEYIALTAKTGRAADTELVAFCQLSKADEPTSEQQIRDCCLDLLPSFAVPDLVKVVSELPRLANGKIDRQAIESMVAELEINT